MRRSFCVHMATHRFANPAPHTCPPPLTLHVASPRGVTRSSSRRSSRRSTACRRWRPRASTCAWWTSATTPLRPRGSRCSRWARGACCRGSCCIMRALGFFSAAQHCGDAAARDAVLALGRACKPGGGQHAVTNGHSPRHSSPNTQAAGFMQQAPPGDPAAAPDDPGASGASRGDEAAAEGDGARRWRGRSYVAGDQGKLLLVRRRRPCRRRVAQGAGGDTQVPGSAAAKTKPPRNRRNAPLPV